MHFQKMKMTVNLFHKPNPADQVVKRADPPTRDRLGLPTHLVVDVSPRHHRLDLTAPLLPTQTTDNSCFPIPKNLPIFSHLKCPFLIYTKHPLRNGPNTFGSLSLCQVYNYHSISQPVGCIKHTSQGRAEEIVGPLRFRNEPSILPTPAVQFPAPPQKTGIFGSEGCWHPSSTSHAPAL